MTRIWLYLQVILWSLLLFFLLILYNPQKVVELVSARKSKSGGLKEKTEVIKCVRSVCKRNPLAGRRHCLHRSFLLYRFLQIYGYSPSLNIGFTINPSLRQEEESISNVHAWITVEDQGVLDDIRYSINKYSHFLWTVSNIHYWVSFEANSTSAMAGEGKLYEWLRRSTDDCRLWDVTVKNCGDDNVE